MRLLAAGIKVPASSAARNTTESPSLLCANLSTAATGTTNPTTMNVRNTHPPCSPGLTTHPPASPTHLFTYTTATCESQPRAYVAVSSHHGQVRGRRWGDGRTHRQRPSFRLPTRGENRDGAEGEAGRVGGRGETHRHLGLKEAAKFMLRGGCGSGDGLWREMAKCGRA